MVSFFLAAATQSGGIEGEEASASMKASFLETDAVSNEAFWRESEALHAMEHGETARGQQEPSNTTTKTTKKNAWKDELVGLEFDKESTKKDGGGGSVRSHGTTSFVLPLASGSRAGSDGGESGSKGKHLD